MRLRPWFFLGALTLLMGSDGVDQTLDDLPACGPNTYLIYRSGKLVCEPALPSCPGQLLHAGPGATLSSLSCVPKLADALTATERQRVQQIDTDLQQIDAQLTAAGVGPVPSATFVGQTTTKTTGRIVFGGRPAGLPSANAMCAAEQGAGTHMCSARELFGAVLNGTLSQMRSVPPAWIYMPTWNTPDPAAQEPLSGLADNCGGYTEGTASPKWSGMAMDWSESVYMERVLQFDSGPLAPCDASLPVACCK